MQIAHPSIFIGSRDSPKTIAEATMTMTRLAVLATDCVPSAVFVIVTCYIGIAIGIAIDMCTCFYLAIHMAAAIIIMSALTFVHLGSLDLTHRPD